MLYNDKKIVLCGKSGSGKNFFRDWLRDRAGLSVDVSYTTRPIRPGETPGDQYFFIGENSFNEMVRNEEFLEHITHNGWQYGTSFESAKESRVFIMTPGGAYQLRQHYPDAIVVYLNATDDLIKLNLHLRGDDPKEVERRLEADKETFMGMGLRQDVITLAFSKRFSPQHIWDIIRRAS